MSGDAGSGDVLASPPSRPGRGLLLAAWVGLLALQYGFAQAYLVRGAWWHYLLHQQVGWGVGLALAAAATALTGRRVPAVAGLLAGQLCSVLPDLQFVLLGMPHTPAMDLWLGHISLHTGPSPVGVALGTVLLGGWAWLAAAYARPRAAAGLAAATVALLATACLLASPIPSTLAEFPRDSAPAALDMSGDRSAATTYACRHTGEEVVRHFVCSSDS